MIELKDEEILLRLANFEDAFVERKSTGDTRDLLKTAVAFANSTPIGYPAILFYGVTDKGAPEGTANLEKLQKTIGDKLSDAYPAIYYLPKVLRQDNKQFLAVVIPGSENRPHFAGQSYIRDGSQTKEASEEQFERLIVERNNKAREILKWCGKEITYRLPKGQNIFFGVSSMLCGGYTHPARVVDCSLFYVTLEFTYEKDTTISAFPLTFIDIGYDCEAHRLKLIGTPY